MIGAIAGDVIGSVYESPRRSIKTTEFPLFSPLCQFTDDTVCTVALAESILTGADYVELLHEYYDRYPLAGYGAMFQEWAANKWTEPYNSWGNGSAMRVSPVGFAFDTLEEVLEEAKRSAAVTHSHPEGIKGAQATASAIFLARSGKSKREIQEYIEETFQYGLRTPLDEIRPHYWFDVSCQGSVPQAITAFLESSDFEDAIRKAISLGGDSDTLACITGGVAQAFYGGVPESIRSQTLDALDDRLREVVFEFTEAYHCG